MLDLPRENANLSDPTISTIVVSFNVARLLRDCLSSVKTALAGRRFEIIVIDNKSSDDSVKVVREHFPDVTLVENRNNEGFAKAVNIGIARMQGDVAFLLNPDAKISREAFDKLLAHLVSNPDVGMIGGQLLNKDGSKQNSFDNFPTLTNVFLNKSLLRKIAPGNYPSKNIEFAAPVEVESLIGAAVLVPRKVIDAVGGLDERYFFFLEETDWCLRIRSAGYKIVHHPGALITHFQGQSKKKAPELAWVEYYRSLYKYFRKNDPRHYEALRVLSAIKLFVNFIGAGSAMILGGIFMEKLRTRFSNYFTLLLWHAAGCPKSVGLRRIGPRRLVF
ncbi:MAG: glycosyltransferase family 2 protein [Planctomycetes bacterium]|nr:glycosyltransferase family 2 protein [Planctomycetota bacterium]